MLKIAEDKFAPQLLEQKLKLEREHELRLASERDRLKREAERAVARDLSKLRAEMDRQKRNADKRERQISENFHSELTEARKAAKRDADEKLKRQIQEIRRIEAAKALSVEARRGDERVALVQRQLDKERQRSSANQSKLLSQVEELSRKLENRTANEIGDSAELDLYEVLRAAFPGDRIQRIKKGAKGSDIVHFIVENSKDVGRIIYESKETSSWQNDFIAQAKRYQHQYETPYALVVSRAFPNKQKHLCIVQGIPVVSAIMAIPLARILRDAAVDVAKYRNAGTSSDEKALTLFDYIISDSFVTRFTAIAEHIANLKLEHTKERDWHERNWSKRSALQEKIEASHREINAHLDTVLQEKPRKPLRSVAVAGR